MTNLLRNKRESGSSCGMLKVKVKVEARYSQEVSNGFVSPDPGKGCPYVLKRKLASSGDLRYSQEVSNGAGSPDPGKECPYISKRKDLRYSQGVSNGAWSSGPRKR